MRKKVFIRILLALTMVINLLSGFSIVANAEETSGNCGANGNNITWEYDADTKTLTFSGTGETRGYNTGDEREWNLYIPYVENIVIGYGITGIRTGFASQHPSLKNIVISETVKSLGVSAFSGCDSLTEVYIPGNVSTIGSMAFVQCDNLTKVHIAEGVENIESRAFQMCNNIKSISIPDSVKNIGYLSFAYCESLENVFIGSGVTSIDEAAFKNSNSISAVYINCTAEEWEEKGLGTAFFPTTAQIYYTDTNGIIRFDANGGYCETLFAAVNNENKIENLPTPVKDYASFEGWYDSEGNEITTDTVFNSAATVYAKWNSRAKITFDAKGGECDTRYLYADENGKLSALPQAIKDRCSFDGWYDAESDNQVTADTVFSDDTTVYAKWSAQKLHTTEWTGYCNTENQVRFDMKDYLPEDADIESVQGSLPLYTGKSQNITYTSDVESSYVILYTRITGHPASESYVITVNTSNYGTITIQAAIKLIDFAIESYNVAENAAYISVPVAGTYTVIFADYDDDRLSNVEAQEIIVTEAGIVPIRITEGFSLEQGDKIMLWSDLAEFKLFCEALTIE